MAGADPVSGRLVQRTIVVLDVVRFSAAERDDHDRRIIRATLREVVARAFAESRLDFGGALVKDTGDGMILLLPERVALPDRILHPWLVNLGVELAHANHTASEATRIRLRISVHQGYLHVDSDDGDGTSADLILACRLVDADPLKHALADVPHVPLGLIVSDAVYQGVVRHRPRGVDPSTYRQVHTRVKETTAPAWIHLPGHVLPPPASPASPAGSVSPPADPTAAAPRSAGGSVFTTFNAPVTFGGDMVQGDKVIKDKVMGDREHPDTWPPKTRTDGGAE